MYLHIPLSKIRSYSQKPCKVSICSETNVRFKTLDDKGIAQNHANRSTKVHGTENAKPLFAFVCSHLHDNW